MPDTPHEDLIEWDEPADGRRRVSGVLVIAALLAVGGVTVTYAVAGERVGRAGVPEEAGLPSDTVTADPAGEANEAGGDALFMQFVDRDHGFALTATCPGDDQACSYGLAVSTDGGRSYRQHALPLAKIPPLEGYSAEMHAVTARTVVIEDRGKWWVSIDAGRTWRSAPDSVTQTHTAIPAAGRLHLRCADADCANRELTAIDPDTGMRRTVPDVPLERVTGSSESTIAPDGTRWVSGTAPGGDPALATTRDGGRTWSVSRFPDPGEMLSGPRLLIGPGDLRYAVFTVQREDAKNGFGPLYGSADAGRTWTLIRNGKGRPASILGAMVRPDGQLLIGTELGGAMTSADGGRTFTRPGAGPGLAHFVERDGMITAMSHDGSHHISRDGGVTWSQVSVPVRGLGTPTR
jgi:photosystem II stability/assembly factor-like uncharacterized protein